MPTFYTAPIEDDENFTFEQFVWRCTLNFDRDAYCGGKTPPLIVAPETKRIEETLLEFQNKYFWALGASEEDLAAAQDKEHSDRVALSEEYDNKQKKYFERYKNILVKISKWKAPTEKHEEFKRFLAQQIYESTKYSLAAGSLYPKPKLDIVSYRAQVLSDCKKSIEFYQKELDQTISRCEERNSWIMALHESIPRTEYEK